VAWQDRPNAAVTPFRASRGTALVSGLATVYAGTATGARGFAETLKSFSSWAPETVVSKSPQERAAFDFKALETNLAGAYRAMLEKSRGGSAGGPA
jgi:hypothetical protein